MPEIPAEAVQAAIDGVDHEYVERRGFDHNAARAALTAAAPILTAAMEKGPIPELPRLRPGNRNPQNLYLVNEDGSETFVGVAMTPEYAEMIVRRFNVATEIEGEARGPR